MAMEAVARVAEAPMAMEAAVRAAEAPIFTNFPRKVPKYHAQHKI